ncbi:MAG: Wzz/FepE/Etk N-terminal domain-containing protein [Gammaproteobacteria bacterium]
MKADTPQRRPGDSDTDFDRVADFVLRNWLLIGIAALVGGIVGWGSSFFMTKIYRAEVLASVVSPESASPIKSLLGQYSGIAGLAGIQVGGEESATAGTIALLRSRIFIEQFIEEQKLLPVLFAKQWDAGQSKWRLKEGARPPTPQDGYGYFMKRVLFVVEDKQNSLVTVRVEWRDPVLAAEWANLLVARINETARDRAIRNSERAVDFLGKELEHTQTLEIRQSIYSLLQSQVNKKMMANTRPDFAFSVIDPAQAPDLNRYSQPVPVLLGVLGFFAGGALGLITALLVPYIRERLASLRRA